MESGPESKGLARVEKICELEARSKDSLLDQLENLKKKK